MALKALEHDAETRFSLEDAFQDHVFEAETSAAKLAWVNGWRKLPHVPPEIQRLFDYPQQFAEDIYNRIEHELRRRDSDSRIGRLYIDPELDSRASEIPELPARYFASEHDDQAQLRRHLQEGHFLVSYETPSGWTGLKKELLTEILGAGRDARIAGLPPDAAQVLRLMCTDLIQR
jgi:hypothetical protein